MITTYLQAREFLESLIKPIPYKNNDIGVQLFDPLDRMRKLLELLDHPEKKFQSVQVSGTSGKGSTAYLLSHILTGAGYKTGFTLSPHLMSITERFQINEKPISEEALLSLVNEIVPAVQLMKESEVGEPTYFEALMALTFLYFAREQVDIAVVEVGLEGRYDGTNTLDPLLFILTNISLDHVEFLGDTTEKIAREATSAITSGEIVISGVAEKNIQEIIEQVCEEKKALLQLVTKQFWSEVKDISEEGGVFDYVSIDNRFENMTVSLIGEHQVENATVAIAASLALAPKGFSVSETHIRQALSSAYFPGRIEHVTYQSQTAILDGAHNPAKMEALVRALEEIYPEETYIVIFACKQYKDISEMIKRLSPITDTIFATRYYTTTEASKNSSMTVEDVTSQLENILVQKKVISVPSIEEALTSAVSLSRETHKKILITGSLYLVGEAKTYLTAQERLLES